MSQTMNITDSSFKIDVTLALAEEVVQLWRVALEAISDESRWQRVPSLTKGSASRFHFPSDLQRFVASRALLRTVLVHI
jgi:phosphopantetheinyl transferase